MYKGKGIKKIDPSMSVVGIEIAQNGVRTYLRRYVIKSKDKEEEKDNAMKLVNQTIFNHYLFGKDGRVNIYEPFALIVRLRGEVIHIDNDKKYKYSVRRVNVRKKARL